MIKVKASEATPLQLDWLVAKCEGHKHIFEVSNNPFPFKLKSWSPSTSWSQGGPILDREYITIEHTDEMPDQYFSCKSKWCLYGPTPLITAMRCYVASKLGDEVEIPKELL